VAEALGRRSSSKDEGAESARRGFFRSFWLVFTVVFIAEWGELTQIATAGFEARYRSPILVFAAATAALWSVAALAVFVGNRAGRLLDARVTQRVAAVLFGLVGIALLVSAR
jgi:putative Ca2+/H+ antiporter (TMEM165/GDT1 family)